LLREDFEVLKTDVAVIKTKPDAMTKNEVDSAVRDNSMSMVAFNNAVWIRTADKEALFPPWPCGL
jgi:hypothetical protein